MSIRRLLRIAAVTIAVSILLAAGLYFYMKRLVPGISGGPGTKVESVQVLSGTATDIFKMPGDLKQASAPLKELLPDGWKSMERRIVVEKSKRILTIYTGSHKVKSYFCTLGFSPVGPKTKRDDGKTPEGTYYICSRNPRSKYELSVLISYPGEREAKAGLESGLIDQATFDIIISALRRKATPPQDTALGSHICIHGGGIGAVAADMSRARIVDWTQGCIALRSEDIKEVYSFACPGTTVEIRP